MLLQYKNVRSFSRLQAFAPRPLAPVRKLLAMPVDTAKSNMVTGLNAAVSAKMAERVEVALGTALNKAPRNIDPRKLLPAIANREQAPRM